MAKTFVYAVHALSYQKMLEKVEEGKMPNFKQLIEKGSHGISKSVFSTSSAVDYISMITGTTPATHGIYDFQTNTIDGSLLGTNPGKSVLKSTDPGELDETRLFTSFDVSVPWVWDLMEDHKVIQMGLFSPATFPAPRLPNDGVWVSGYWNRPEPFLRKNTAACNDPEVRKTLTGEYEDYQMTPLMAIPPAYPDVDNEFDYLKAKLEADKELSRKTQEARMKVLEHGDWDIFLTEEFFTDNIQHLLWPHSEGNPLYDRDVDPKLKDEDLLGQFYRHVDDILGEYMERLDEKTNIIIISAHGQKEAEEAEYMHDNFHKLLEYGIWQSPGGWKYREENDFNPHSRAEHTFDGTFIASGPDFRQLGEIQPISCMDFTPLMLDIYGYEPPRHVEGASPGHVLDKDSTSR